MRVLVTGKDSVKIDLTDRKILYLLSKNAKYSYSTISKHVNLSREAVKKRIDRLISKNVLLGFQTLIDVSKLGYSSYHVFFQMRTPTKENEEKVVFDLIDDGNVNALLKYNGKFDYEAAYMLKSINDLNNKLRSLSLYDINDSDVCVLINTIISKTYPKAMFKEDMTLQKIGRDGSFHSFFEKKEKEHSIDKVDLKLLSVISDDARISMVDLSSKIGVGVDSCIYRIKKLIESKIILEFRPIINYAALGYSVYCLFFRFKNLTGQNESDFMNYIKEHNNFLWSVNCIGHYNNISYVIVKDNFEFQDVISDLREKFSNIISSYESMLSFSEHKYTYFPKCIN